MNLKNITVEKFRKLVGKKIFTVSFVKDNGEVRVMNAMLGVAKYVKGTQEEATAKRTATNTANNKIGCYEMRGTSDRVEEGLPTDDLFTAKNYRTINLNTLIYVHADGEKYTVEG